MAGGSNVDHQGANFRLGRKSFCRTARQKLASFVLREIKTNQVFKRTGREKTHERSQRTILAPVSRRGSARLGNGDQLGIISRNEKWAPFQPGLGSRSRPTGYADRLRLRGRRRPSLARRRCPRRVRRQNHREVGVPHCPRAQSLVASGLAEDLPIRADRPPQPL